MRHNPPAANPAAIVSLITVLDAAERAAAVLRRLHKGVLRVNGDEDIVERAQAYWTSKLADDVRSALRDLDAATTAKEGV